MRTYRLRLSEGRWGCVGGGGLVFIPRVEAKGVPSLADHLKELEVILLACASLDEEPVDNRPDIAGSTCEELEDTETSITKHKAVDAEASDEDRDEE